MVFFSCRYQGSGAFNNVSKVTQLVNATVRISSHVHCLLLGTPVAAPCQSLCPNVHNAMLSWTE